MKKIYILLIIILLFGLILNLISAEACDLGVTMLNQDPYPAVPGGSVKVVFQVTGVDNPECGKISFKLIEDYPFSLEQNVSSELSIEGGTYQKDFSSHWLIPYKLKVNKDAIEGENDLEVRLSTNNLNLFSVTKKFPIEVKNVLADFELFVKDYNFETKTLTLGILNIGETDVKSLTLEIPKQENIKVSGSNVNVLGDLDSNDDTTADFKGVLKKGDIKVKISYNDIIDERRVLKKTVIFDPEYFTTSNNKKSTSWYLYIIILVVVVVVVYFFYIKNKKRKKRIRNRRSASI